MESIHFFSEEIDFDLAKKEIFRSWIKQVIDRESLNLGGLNIIFCSDSYLLELNQQYLSKNHLSDIITFDHSESGIIQGDIYISITRVKENASKFQTSFENELSRVMIHGVLHLIGFGDTSDKEKELMRKKEEASLSLLPH